MHGGLPPPPHPQAIHPGVTLADTILAVLEHPPKQAAARRPEQPDDAQS
jgi:hypothetical protein